jgi:hypothetical protein
MSSLAMHVTVLVTAIELNGRGAIGYEQADIRNPNHGIGAIR